uniref:Uncharacterized protein n=1 Tax=Rhizophora mucronata TaxID=61149 RepID=A0A2P2KF53_RHIMU
MVIVQSSIKVKAHVLHIVLPQHISWRESLADK